MGVALKRIFSHGYLMIGEGLHCGGANCRTRMALSESWESSSLVRCQKRNVQKLQTFISLIETASRLPKRGVIR